MIKNLWTFGSSNTAPIHKQTCGKEYIEWKGYKPKIWPEIIAEELKCNLKNVSVAGCDNYSIFEMICNFSNQIKENDVIIISWTNPIRFRLVSEVDDDSWVYVLSNFDKSIYKHFNNTISENTLIEILYNRKSNKYLNEIHSWTQLINNTFKKNQIIHWSEFFKLPNVEQMKNFETINTDTNGKINDYHFSEKGNYDIAKTLINTGKLTRKINFL